MADEDRKKREAVVPRRPTPLFGLCLRGTARNRDPKSPVRQQCRPGFSGRVVGSTERLERGARNGSGEVARRILDRGLDQSRKAEKQTKRRVNGCKAGDRPNGESKAARPATDRSASQRPQGRRQTKRRVKGRKAGDGPNGESKAERPATDQTASHRPQGR
jgi:hypothetical protein